MDQVCFCFCQQYELFFQPKLMKDAVEAQRNGDIATYSELSSKAEDCAKKIDQLKSDTN